MTRVTIVECKQCGKKANLHSIEIAGWIEVRDLFFDTGMIWSSPSALFFGHRKFNGDFCSVACFEQYVKAREG